MKKDLRHLTFCIPIRVDSTYRMHNLLSLLKFYSRHIATNYIILEADKRQHLTKLPRIPGLVYEFVYDENSIFHRTHYINRMFSMASTPLAAVWDTDVIVPVPQVNEAYEKLLNANVVMVYPYDGRFWHINSFFAHCFHEHLKIRILTDSDMPRVLMSGYNSVGGAYMVNIDLYKRYGWENEYFVGWGPEDCERYKRLCILGQTPFRVKGSLYHLYHPRGINSGDFKEELAYQTKKEYCHVCGMMPEELRQYVNTWNWIK
nr:galactosyltransferase-related protein [uncultured Bacteroides sp.]